MRDPLVSIVNKAVASPTAVAVGRMFTVGRLRVLAFHGIDDEEVFSHQMEWLDATFSVVSPSVLGRQGLPTDAVVVTFDDGDPTVVHKGLPVLAALGIEAVAFVCPSVVDSQQPLWWQLLAIGAQHDLTLADGRPVDAVLTAGLKAVSDAERLSVIREVSNTLDQLSIPLSWPQMTLGDIESWVAAGHTSATTHGHTPSSTAVTNRSSAPRSSKPMNG